MKRKLTFSTLMLLLATLGTCGWIWQRNGAYGFNVLFRRGDTYWIHMNADDPRLSPSMRLAQRTPPSVAAPGTLAWKEIDKGFEVAELSVMANGSEVDRILLNRIDPARFRFVVRNAADGTMGLDEWERALPKAVLIVNGSYSDLEFCRKFARPWRERKGLLSRANHDAPQPVLANKSAIGQPPTLYGNMSLAVISNE